MVFRVLDDADVAEVALRRQETGFLVEDGAEELVGRTEALHQDVALSVMNQLDGAGNGLELVRLVDDFELFYVDIVLGADVLDHLLVTHEGGGDDPEVNSLAGSFDGMLVHGPGRDHALADIAGFQLGENIRKFGNHSCVYCVLCQSSRDSTMCIVSRAMTSSSLVQISAALTVEFGAVMTASSAQAVLAS